MIKEFTKDMECFEGVYWVSGIKKDASDMRCHVRYMMVKDGKLVSTDGSQLRECEVPEGIEEGFYSVVKRIKSRIELTKAFDLCDGSFPDYEDILVPKEEHKLIDIRYKSTVDDMYPLDFGLSAAIREMKTGSFDVKKWIDIVEGMAFNEVLVAADGCRPALFIGEGFKGALMPCPV